MPARAPTPCRKPGCGRLCSDGYCAAHAPKTLYAAPRKASSTARGYGIEWQRRRKSVLHRDCGLCVVCLANGLYVSATEVDHIVPKVDGGTDAMENLQAICRPCHQAKSRTESGATTRAKRLPAIGRKPACRVVLVAGCPGSGKSAYVAERVQPGDLVIDLDLIQVEITGAPIHQTPLDGNLLAQSMRRRNAMLFGLHRVKASATAWFIVGAPSRRERDHWREQLGAEVIVIEAAPPEAKRRIAADPTRAGREQLSYSWVDKWWRTYVASAKDVVIRQG